MTVVLALRKEFEDSPPYIVYGSDTLLVRGDEKTNLTKGKFIEYDNFIVLFSGVASVRHTLEEFFTKKSLRRRKFMEMKDSTDALDFIAEVTKRLKERLGELGSADAEESSNFQLILVTPHMLYSIDKWGYVTESPDFAIGGSGANCITGLVNSHYPNIEDKEMLVDLANEALIQACQLNLYCGEPIVIKEWDTE